MLLKRQIAQVIHEYMLRVDNLILNFEVEHEETVNSKLN